MYWTLLTLRMMAWLGLALTVMWWVVGQWRPGHAGVAIGAVHVRVGTNRFSNAVIWVPVAQARAFGKDVSDILNYINEEHADGTLPGIIYRFRDLNASGFVRVDHWLLCLTFLLGKVVTSWRREEPVAEPRK